MTRYLFVVPPLVGHINPAVAVAAELTARGHRVAWAGMPEIVGVLTGRAAQVFPCALPRGRSGGTVERPASLCGVAALQYLWEDFLIPLGEVMAPDVLAAVEEFRPDVLVVDQQAVAGALIAERLDIPWVTSAATSAEFTGALDGMPLLDAWLTERFDDLRSRTGDPLGGKDPRFSPHLILAFTTPQLAGSVSAPSGPICFVGPSIHPPAAFGDFPRDWLDGRELVLVSPGTADADAGADFLAAAHAALRDRRDRLQGIILDPADLLESAASTSSVLVRPVVPRLELLQWCSAVVCDAGHHTVCEALWHGVPLVVAPIRDDQPVVAEQVVAAGAGIRVRFERMTPERLGDALDLVLDDPRHRRAAQRVGDSFHAAGGAAAAAQYIEAVT